MAMSPFLAMTAAEIRECDALPEKIAWMACHFSPYGRGLSNLPRTLPEGFLLMVDDITPIHGHDPQLIAKQLAHCSQALEISGILLDFQRPKDPETAALIQSLPRDLPCPIAVPESYADDTDLPVFLSPVPPSVPLREHLSGWRDREIWLDVSPRGEILQLSENGCKTQDLLPGKFPDPGFLEEDLFCHYHTEVSEDTVRFTLWRTKDDLSRLLEEANAQGVTRAVGLYQEFSVII